MYKIRIINLIFIFLLLFILVDLEVAELVALLGVCHHTQPVTKVVFLQVLLCQILQVSAQQETKTVSAVKFVIVIFFYSLNTGNIMQSMQPILKLVMFTLQFTVIEKQTI